MRLLLSFILSFFIFAAPQQGMAAGMPEYRVDKAKTNSLKKSQGQHPVTIDCITSITVPANNNASGSRDNVFLWAGINNSAYNNVAYPLSPVKKASFTHSYLYYKEAGLRSLFPKHSFL